jgi:hypothetical protein
LRVIGWRLEQVVELKDDIDAILLTMTAWMTAPRAEAVVNRPLITNPRRSCSLILSARMPLS